MTDDEIALRAALNILRDSIESGRMPSGLALTNDAKLLHERAADHIERLLLRRATTPKAQTASTRRRSKKSFDSVSIMRIILTEFEKEHES